MNSTYTQHDLLIVGVTTTIEELNFKSSKTSTTPFYPPLSLSCCSLH